MEDPEESETDQEYYSSSKEDEDDVVKWMLSKGYVIGRKMVITGIVMSSAPLVLPPLAVFSVMGVAFSVPFGLLYASYACTNKIMNILLPSYKPPSPMRMEYYYYCTAAGDQCKLGLDVAENEHEDLNQGVDILLELDDDYRQELGPTLMTNVDKDLDEMEMDSDMVERENVTEEEEREQMEDVTQRVVVEMSPSFNVAGDGLLEEEMENTVEDGYVVSESSASEGVAEIIEPVTAEGIESQKLVQVGSKNDEEPVRDVAVLFDENKNSSNSREVEMSPSFNVAGDDLREEETKNTVGDGYVVSESSASEGVADIIEPLTVKEIESQKLVQVGSKNDEEPVPDVVVLFDENKNNSNSREAEAEELDQNKDERRVESDASRDGSEDVVLIPSMDQHWIRANADPRDLVLLDETRNSTNINFKVGDEVEEKSAHENVDVLVHSPIKPVALDKKNAKNASETYKKLSSKEKNLDDEKMWEKIGAMRAIVGYKAPSQPTCLGELKALYVFTGVEPPASFEGDSNLDEVDVKLKFLMAIVGVK